MKTEMWTWMRVQFFRFWTALVVLGAYTYFWLNTPEYLTWWKRTVNTLIEKGCDMSHILGGTESSRQSVTSGSGCKSLSPS
jgi:hypothetical protein